MLPFGFIANTPFMKALPTHISFQENLFFVPAACLAKLFWSDLHFGHMDFYESVTDRRQLNIWACASDSQHRTLMQAACRLFSALMNERIPITKRFPKQVMKAITHTDTRRTRLANRSSTDEIPSVLGLHFRTCGA